MIKSLVFDKDGVILDLIATWFPVVQALTEYTLTRLPAGTEGTVSRADLLAAIGVNEAEGYIDPLGIFAMGSFHDIREVWQALLPQGMVKLEDDVEYRSEVKRLALEMAHGNSVAKGDVVTPLQRVFDAGFKIALLTNDSEGSARQSLIELGIEHIFDPIIGADSGFGGKPEPRGLIHCMDAHGSTPEETLMIGDTGADYGVAINGKVADFICIADDPQFRPHENVKVENVIARLTELPDLLIRRGDMGASV